MRLAYFPGCSLEGSSAAYEISVRAVCEVVGIELVEIADWNCCGATEAPATSQLVAHALAARNLALVPPGLDQVMAPCSACYLNLRRTDAQMARHPDLASKVNSALAAGQLSYTPGRLDVRHLLDLLYHDVGRAALRARVVRPLRSVRVAPYYGCQLVRPRSARYDSTEHPTLLDQLLGWLGATVVDYPLKTHCCGGHMSRISRGMSDELLRRLLHNAEEYEADVIACVCPMCQLNLDAYQSHVNHSFGTSFELPAVFFTQLVGLAFGLEPEALGFDMEIVAAMPLLETKLGTPPEQSPDGG